MYLTKEKSFVIKSAIVALAVLSFACVIFFPKNAQAAYQCPSGFQVFQDNSYGGNAYCVIPGQETPTGFNNCPAGTQSMGIQGGVICASPTPPTGTADQSPAAAVSCSGLWNFFSSPVTCTWRAAIAGLSSIFIYIGVWFLSLGALLFNAILQLTVVDFKGSLGGLLNGVDTTWKSIRDLANIFIIMMFTFIAINIIIGNQTFGSKKLVARLLIIAILINFSLLFTKLVIDASNFTAAQLYQTMAIAPSTANQNTQVSAGAAAQSNDGIAGQFLGLLGISGFADTFDAVRKIADANDSGWIALIHGIFSFILLMGAGVVFFYGALLLAIRAITFIVLMTGSALAFFFYIFAGASASVPLWDRWLSALIKNALFAPLLMIFLAAALTISKGFASIAQGGTLGSAITNPTASANMAAIFNYIVVLGLLYASIRLANSFSISSTGAGLQTWNSRGKKAVNYVSSFANRRLFQPASSYARGQYAATTNAYRGYGPQAGAQRNPATAPLNARIPGISPAGVLPNQRARQQAQPLPGGIVGGATARGTQQMAQQAKTPAPATSTPAPAPVESPKINVPPTPKQPLTPAPSAQGTTNASTALATESEGVKIQKVTEDLAQRSRDARFTGPAANGNARLKNLFTNRQSEGAANDNEPPKAPTGGAAAATIQQNSDTPAVIAQPGRFSPGRIASGQKLGPQNPPGINMNLRPNNPPPPSMDKAA